MINIIYLDNSATTNITQPVLDVMMPYLTTQYYNPSSIYSPSRKVHNDIEQARKTIAKAINAKPNEIYFTSGGSESNSWVISNFLSVLTSNIEHHSILNAPNTFNAIKVNQNGMVDNLENIPTLIRDYTARLVSVMYVNNEIGTIQPIKQIAEICHKNNTLIHTDAVQAFGSTKIDVKEIGVDFLSLSGHKFHAPKGTGVLYIKEGRNLLPLIYGGKQEKHKRGSTENIIGIIGMAKAMELYNYDIEKSLRVSNMRDKLLNIIQSNVSDIIINGDMKNKVCGNLNISFKGIEAESLSLQLDMEDICVSAGSACNSGSLDPSHVLQAINVPEDYIRGTIRISINEFNTNEEIEYVGNKIIEIVNKLRAINNYYNYKS